MMKTADEVKFENNEAANRSKSRLAGILRSFSSAGSYSKRKVPTISNPRAEFPFAKPNLSAKRDRVFLDVLQDYLPNEPAQSAGSAARSRFLNIYRGEIVQLLEPAPNNLVKVRLVNRLGQGLVPARCVAVNVELTPSKMAQQGSQEDLEVSEPGSPTLSQKLESEPETESESESPKPQAPASGLNAVEKCQVVGIHMWENRILYRIDCIMRSGHRRALSRFYQDFYSLQLQLRDRMVEEGIEDPQEVLPGLPSPSRKVDDSKVTNRLDVFNEYLHQIISSEHISQSIKRDVVLDKWLSLRPGDLVKTQRGSLYKVNEAASESREDFTWESLDPSTSIDALDRDLSPLPTDWNLGALGGPKAKPPIPRAPSLTDMPVRRKPLMKLSADSAPTTPITNTLAKCLTPTSAPPSPEQVGTDHVKVKILHKDDCYAAKCTLSELESYEKLDSLCRSKLKSCLTSADCPLTISYVNDKKEPLELSREIFDDVLPKLVLAASGSIVTKLTFRVVAA
ncbi:KLTH0G05742p [Lachancea thermotolerans CBS 6340]|uniref:KLTH0G05742p n=1 Tax=Lachancea thermotolerans (strain ATCC 56472 / CBS 6340 / NRRL Y-8284) TaxID=559295 RepID=C5DM39_LACTC|nr:KLTH0G05742p [Lachancea thermotolerans CBS 6340]CAR24850.1 KLTH0G05742p [Lachancea thermotolerans CBS 6340]